jgi:hypothetical protein
MLAVMAHDAEDAAERLETGHDLHFLERLERVDLAQTELALRLYRSPDLVRSLLEDPTCPQGAERVAVAIQPGPSPAHVVVARGGAFVTCLGAGMEVGATPILAWERLSIHLHRDDAQLRQIARADETLKRQDARALFKRLYNAGPALTREEFVQLLAIEPILYQTFADEVLHTYKEISRLAPMVARIKRIRSSDERLLRFFWTSFFAAGHLLLLASLGGKRSFAEWGTIAEQNDFNVFERFYLRLCDFGFGPTALRAIWAIGRAGKVALPWLKRSIGECQRLSDWHAPALALLAVGLRHQRLRTEIVSALGPARLPPSDREDPNAQKWAQVLQTILRGEVIDFDAPPEEQASRVRVFAGTVLAMLDPNRSSTGAPGNREIEPWVANPWVITHLANWPFDFFRRNDTFAMMPLATLVMANQPPEAFYFPAAEIDRALPYDPNLAVSLAWFARPGGPVRVEPKVGRNDPCTCGSGKKFKKCCAG